MKTLDREWRTRFERFGRSYAEEHEVSGWSAEGLARRFRLFEKLFGQFSLPKDPTILELGCGAGTYVRYLAGLGQRVVGLDYSLPSLQRALKADPGRTSRYVAANGYALPFASMSFDLVICIGVLQAVSCPGRLLEEITRVLRPQGFVVLEALNALELPAMVHHFMEALVGRVPRVRCYVPFQVREWLQQRSIRPVQRVGVYLPPRRFPWLGRVFDRWRVVRLLEAIPGGALLGAHAFWLIGQKSR